MTCLWTSLVGVQTDCSTDEFWLNSSGEFVAEGSFDFWISSITLYRMTVVRGAHGEVLSYAPSLSTDPVIFDWSRSGGLDDPFTPGLTGQTVNAWSLNAPYVQSGILTVQPSGSRTSTVFSFSTNVYADVGFEVVWV